MNADDHIRSFVFLVLVRGCAMNSLGRDSFHPASLTSVGSP